MVQALIMCSVLAAFFYIGAGVLYGDWGLWYLVANLLLAWVPLLLNYLWFTSIQRHGWRDARSGLWGLAWLGFLPNSYYLLTDFIHLTDGSVKLDPVYGSVVFGVFSFVGLAIGFYSLYLVHRQLLKRMSSPSAYLVIEAVLVLSSIAIYLGRVLRWNTWDLIIQPWVIAGDVIWELANLSSLSVMITVSFAILLSGLYAAIWRVAK